MSRARRGALAYAAGQAAEESAARHYADRGLTIAHRRWRGPGGEVDLVVRDGAAVVFVEVKRAATLDAAAHRLRPAQVARLCASAEAFCGAEPAGSLTPMRFDLALVDALGRVSVIENAFGADW